MPVLNQTRAGILRAFSHPTRVEILELLRSGEKCVCKIVPALDLDQPNVSQHLAILREQGLVVTERRGTQIYYRAADRQIFKLIDLVDQIILNQLTKVKSRLEEVRKV